MQFRDITGQKEIKEQLIQSVRDNRVSHAQLFLGPEGSGALALAVAYAQYLFCENRETHDSCGKCLPCRQVQKYMHPDLHFSYPFIAAKTDHIHVCTDVLGKWRAALSENFYLGLPTWLSYLNIENRQPNINIAECHAIIKKLILKPFEAEKKILIMWLPEFLGTGGNSLLKLIEEPPPNTFILFVAESSEHILATILSRIQLLKIKKLAFSEISEYLIKEKGQAKNSANKIARLADGNMAKALNILKHQDEHEIKKMIDWMRICYSGNPKDMTDWTENFSKKGREEQKHFLELALIIIRNSLLFSNGIHELVHEQEDEREFLQKFSKLIHINNATEMIHIIETAIYHVERNANPKILFLDVSLKLNKCFKQPSVQLN